jgi:hypothetical protein
MHMTLILSNAVYTTTTIFICSYMFTIVGLYYYFYNSAVAP